MLIHPATFEALLAKRGFSQRKLAQVSEVAERTLSRIKNQEDLRRSTVERIAQALQTDPEVLCKPPNEKVNGQDRYESWERDVLCYTYNVSPEVVSEVGLYLFSRVAKHALALRRKRLDEWWEKVEAAAEQSPTPREIDGPSGDATLWVDDAYDEELEDINSFRIDAKPGSDTDFFFEAMKDLGLFEGFGDYGNPDAPHKLSYLEDYACLDFDLYDAANRIAGYPNAPLSEKASIELIGLSVSLLEMPVKLRGYKKTFERNLWILSEGGRKTLPECYYHMDKIDRAIQVEECRANLSKLEQADASGSPDQEKSLQYCRRKLSEAEAKIQSEDWQWYERYQDWCVLVEKAEDALEELDKLKEALAEQDGDAKEVSDKIDSASIKVENCLAALGSGLIASI